MSPSGARGNSPGAFADEFQSPFQSAQERYVAIEVGTLSPLDEFRGFPGEARQIDERRAIPLVKRHREDADLDGSRRADRDW